MTTQRLLKTFRAGLGVGIAALCLAVVRQASADPTVIWTNIVGNAMWNTTDQTWVGPSNDVDGYTVLFRNQYDTRSVKAIYIGPAGPTPVDVAPGTSRWDNSGAWVMSGGGTPTP